MRIVLANRLSGAIGGVEEYLRRIGPGLKARGHALAYYFEHAGGGASIASADDTVWVADTLPDHGMSRLREWSPDIVYCNGLDSPKLENDIATVASSVYSAHAFSGTCISGRKLHSFPTKQICSKVFGPSCLAHYLPRRCGGLNPVTMLSAYDQERARLAAIRSYRRVVVHSAYMQNEYERHGIASTIVSLPAPRWLGDAKPKPPTALSPNPTILFLGRLYDLKGCDLLLDAAADASHALPGLRLLIAGEGPQREKLELHSEAIASSAPKLTVRFVGQVDIDERDQIYARTDVLAVPSIWPEPYGMVGIEAAAFGIPAVAFAVGGIPEWLKDGVTGLLARPRTAEALAASLVECLGNVDTYSRLSVGARAAYEEVARKDTVSALEGVFEAAAMKPR